MLLVGNTCAQPRIHWKPSLHAIVYEIFSPPIPLLILVETEQIVMNSEHCNDVVISSSSAAMVRESVCLVKGDIIL